MNESVRHAGTRSTTAARPDDRRPRTHRRRRRRWPHVVGTLVILGVLAMLAVLPALAARRHLEAGRDMLVGARDRLLAGDVGGAREAFERAGAEFDDARGSGRTPVLWAAGSVPLVGRSADAIVVIADAGRRAASAGVEITRAIEELPSGIEALAPSDGRLPVDTIAALEPAVSAARADLEAAYRDLERLPTSFLLGPVAGARDEALHEVGRAVEAARAAEALTIALPDLVGADARLRYFVGAQATAELRGTGGLIGAYTILEARNGRLVMEPMRSIHTLPDLSRRAAPEPPDGFGAPFDGFGGPGFWRNLNMTPDAPTAATLIESLYEEVTGERVDGVILVDAQTLSEMLEATGPVRPPSFDRTLEADSVVDYLTNEAYLEFGSEAERKRVLGAAVLAVWNRFLSGTDPIAAFRALSEAAAGGHLVLHSADERVQAGLEAAGVAGAWDAPEAGTLLGVATSNADGTKVDYYLNRDVRYEIELAAEGSGNILATTTFTNEAPVDADPSYVFGPYPGIGLGAGDSRAFVAAYCAPACALEGARRDGEPVGVESHSDRGLPVFTTFVRTDAGGTSSLELETTQPDAWVGDEFGGTYELTVRGQPTIKPTTGTVVIDVPPGMRVVDTSVPMEVVDGRATWHGTLGREQRIAIRFEVPFPDRFWTQLGDVLTSPVIEL